MVHQPHVASRHRPHTRRRVLDGAGGERASEQGEVRVVDVFVGGDEQQREAALAHGSDVILFVIVMSKIYNHDDNYDDVVDKDDDNDEYGE